MPRFPLPALALALAASSLAWLPVPMATAAATAAAPADRAIGFTRWETGKDLRTGARKALKVKQGALVLDGTVRARTYGSTKYDVGTWTSAWTTPAAPFTQLIASWSATTPRNSWVEVRVRVTDGATTGRWQVLGRWASKDKHVERTSVPGQSDALGRVDVDTWKATTAATGYQLQARLMRRAGATSGPPTISTLGAMVSALPASTTGISTPAAALGTVLNVPTYSQMIHAGEFPQYGGGGEAWCSPTSLSMVLGYYGKLPAVPSWVGARADGFVDEVAQIGRAHV